MQHDLNDTMELVKVMEQGDFIGTVAATQEESALNNSNYRKNATLGAVLVLAALSGSVFAEETAQAERPPPCTQPEAQQFDFWVGEWDLAWGDGDRGRNVIEKTLDGCVILENFDGTPASPLRGMSVSTYNPRLGKWQQTWVDNQGDYLDFTGGYEDARMVLQRTATAADGRHVLQRMVWYDIAGDSLQWHWESSRDDGATWDVLWSIRYTRANTT